MTFFSPKEAPTVHIEQLPANVLAVDAVVKDYIPTRQSPVPAMFITAWTTSKKAMSCVEGESTDSFFDNNCDGCEYHCDDMEISSDGDYSIDHYDHGTLRIWGSIRVDSPCPCYNDGLGEVSWPCSAGHDEPGGTEESDRTLSLEYMTYGIHLTLLGSKLDDYAAQQSCIEEDGVVTVGSEERAINTFDSRNNICWGDNNEGMSLLEIESLYKTAPCNEDLLTFDGHDDGTDSCTDDPEDPLDTAIWLGDYNHRPRALACANAAGMPNAYILLATSGVKTNDTGIAYVPVSLYENVAVDDDTVLDVWVSDELPIGKRLMFLQYGLEESFRSILLGQIPTDFNLEPCKSAAQQLSELVARDNPCFPA